MTFAIRCRLPTVDEVESDLRARFCRVDERQLFRTSEIDPWTLNNIWRVSGLESIISR